MNLFVYARNCVKNAILCLQQALFTRHGRHAANAAYTHLAFAGKQSRHRAHNIPYGSESVWKGCVFPRLAAREVHATLPNAF